MAEKPTYEELEERVLQLEQALQLETSSRTHKLYEGSPIAYQSLDENGLILEVNSSWLEALGYLREEVIGKSFRHFLHSDWKNHFNENFPRFKAVGEVLGVELKMVKKDGSSILVSLNGKVGKDEYGCFKQTHCIFQDITTYRKKEDELKQNKNLLKLIVNSFNGFIYTVLENYQIEFMNTALLNYVGYNAVGENCFKVIHGLDEKCPWCRGKSVFSGEVSSFEQKSPKDNKWYYYASTPRLDSNGKTVAQQIVAIDINDRKMRENELEKSKKQLQQENILLKSVNINRYGLDNIVGHSLQMQRIYNLILDVASSDAGVLISGESGTGKELVANAIHNLGSRKDQVFLPVNCGGIPENLIESEFFGYQKGAFTGANIDKSGFLAIADEGTLFLDEIGDINLNMQVKMLRVLDGEGYTPLGGNMPIKPNIRVIAATNKDLNNLVTKKIMRADFFYRINVVPIHIPPLRKRKEDIMLLIYHFLRRFSGNNPIPHIPPQIMTELENYDWPGNVRELQNIIHRYVVLNKLDVFDSFFSKRGESESVQEVELSLNRQILNLNDAIQKYEKKIITHCLKKNQWKQSRVALILGVNRKTLYTKIKKYGIVKF
ncbi:sigma-54-dependent Fis family transcriptional regulator [Desulfobacula toluolica]|uniref:Sigma54 specific transcriptional regulator modulated PAS sensor domain n=1 Tax=Desulfobacula toluolica (strain DSM 7467 / Tol2) TaxID=651182 RepID=K0NIZ1_DESTT|nr:sigma-54-dependent Fis family transcriptional regulator [Desulfobacula toluolica]CCK81421.1 sigma54 specific transcriptional regulator modulated PAS sensor domain [Desulfobacula toluolica Tol2]